jgi:hypothetical protein
VVGDPAATYSESAPRVAVFPDGSAAFAWEYRDPYGTKVRVRRVAADGTPDAGWTELAAPADVPSGGLAWPTVSARADGSFVVAYQTKQFSETVLSIDVQRFAADGKPDGAPLRVDSLGYDSLQGPEVAALADGGFVVAFPGLQTGGWSSTDAWVRWFQPDGTPRGDEIQANTWLNGDQMMVRVAALPGGSAVVAWASCEIVGTPYTAQDGAACGVYVQRFGADGKRLYR